MAIPSILGALKYMPASIARKALEKVNPGFKTYFAKSLAFGVDANHALDYLTDRFESDTQRQRKQHLQQGAANKTLRPDEMVSKSEMSNQALPGKALKTVASFATGGLLGGIGDTTSPSGPQNAEQAQKENIKKAKTRGPLSRESLQEDIDEESKADKRLQALDRIAQMLRSGQ